MDLIRLDPGNERAWALWPRLEARVRAFCVDYAPDTPPDALIRALRTRFCETPESLGAWVLVTEDSQIVMHLVGWVDLYWGEPYLLIAQAWHEPGEVLGSWCQRFIEALDQWAIVVNRQYASSGLSCRVTHMRWFTERPEAWCRYLQDRPHRQVTVLSLPVGREE